MRKVSKRHLVKNTEDFLHVILFFKPHIVKVIVHAYKRNNVSHDL